MLPPTRRGSLAVGALEDFQLPPGYRLDLTHDPDVPHLRREDGYPIAIFGSGAAGRACPDEGL